MSDLDDIAAVLGLDVEDAAIVLDLCVFLDEEDVIATHGYARDTPRGRDLQARLREPRFRARLLLLAQEEQVAPYILDAIRGG